MTPDMTLAEARDLNVWRPGVSWQEQAEARMACLIKEVDRLQAQLTHIHEGAKERAFIAWNNAAAYTVQEDLIIVVNAILDGIATPEPGHIEKALNEWACDSGLALVLPTGWQDEVLARIPSQQTQATP